MSLFNSSLGSERIEEILNKKDVSIFFLGIGGVGMSSLALLFKSRGYSVSGYDRDKKSEVVEKLRESGVKIIDGVTELKCEEYGLLVYTLAIDESDPIYILASSLGVPTVSRAELLGVVMRDYKKRIAVAGTHGKSTTTAIIDCILSYGGYNPTTVSGAPIKDGLAFREGGEEYFVFEACEYKNSFLNFKPTSAIITSIELDHTDFFTGLQMLEESYLDFANSCSDFVIVNESCVNNIKSRIKAPVFTFSDREGADFVYRITHREKGIRSFALFCRGRRVGEFHLRTISDCVVSDAAMAVALLYLCGVDVKSISTGLATFSGIPRRLEYISTLDGRAVIYDYAHHPTEIRETIKAVRGEWGKCTVVFCPHTYSRTAALWEDFVTSLSLSDHLVLTDIYAAREVAIEGVSSEHLAGRIRGAVCLSPREVYPYVKEKTEGAVILMGAGNLDVVRDSFL